MIANVLSFLFAMAVVQGSQGPPADNARLATGVVHGRVTARDTGRPIPRAVVVLSRPDSIPIHAVTDDGGQYRVEGVPPAEYQGWVEPGEHRATYLRQPIALSGRLRPMFTLAAGEIREIDISLQPALAIGVRVVDEWGGPLAQVVVTARQTSGQEHRTSLTRPTDDRGRMRLFGLGPGHYILCADTVSTGRAIRRTTAPAERFVRTCHPSAWNEAEAIPVELQGQDLEGVEIRMLRSRAYSLSGVVLDESGVPASHARVSLNRSDAEGGWSFSVPVQGDGRFSIGNVVPGEYSITAQAGSPNMRPQDRQLQMAYQAVRVEDTDIHELALTMVSTFDVRGRIVTEDHAGDVSKTMGTGLMIGARLWDDTLPGSGSRWSALAGLDGSFLLSRMFGRRVVEVANVPGGWHVMAIRYRGRDITQAPADFTADGGLLEVVLSRRGAFVVGRVLDSRGEPALSGRVLMMPADADWRALQPYRTAPVAQDGTFRVGPARPGEYVVVALPPDVRPPSPGDRDQLARLAQTGETLTLAADEERWVDLRLSRRPAP